MSDSESDQSTDDQGPSRPVRSKSRPTPPRKKMKSQEKSRRKEMASPLISDKESSDSDVEPANPVKSKSSSKVELKPVIPRARSALTPSPLQSEEEVTLTDSDSDSDGEEAKREIEAGRLRRMAHDPRQDLIMSRRPTLVAKSRTRTASSQRLSSTSKRKSMVSSSDEASSPSDDDERVSKRTRTKSPPSQAQSQKKQTPKKPIPRPNQTRTRPKPKPNNQRPSSSSQTTSQSQSQGLFSQRLGTSVPGVIKSIRLQNFMCHSDFTHDFHHNLNFITGQNGSGKSALLSAILVGLGGKASVTSRTNSLKSLIQKGKSTFRVSVTLMNQNGLRRYGDELTIERWVNQSGSGGYKIKTVGGYDPDNHWRTMKKPELDNIRIALNIQIDNPVAILNQEVARSFLRSKDPKVKYNLFYEGTLLSKLKTVLDETTQEVEETKVILKKQRQNIHQVQREIKGLKLKVEKIEELNKMKNKFHRIHCEYVWSIVIQSERQLEKQQNSIRLNQKNLEALQSKVDETKATLEKLNENSILTEQRALRQQLTETKNRFDQIRVDLGERKKLVGNLRLKLKAAISTISSKSAQVERLTHQIQQLRAEQEAKALEESNQDEDTLKQLQEKKKHLEGSASTLKHDADDIQQAGEGANEKLQELQNQERNIRYQIDLKKKNIQNIGSNADKFAPFGRMMEQLMAQIELNKNKFRQPPRGPLGAHIRVKVPQFTALVEVILKGHLDSFVVDNGHDLNLLRGLIKRVYEPSQSQRFSQGQHGGRTPAAIMVKFQNHTYDISRHHVQMPEALSLFDAIEVENNDPVITNVLIDMVEIERQVLFKTKEEACNVFKDEYKCHQYPSLKAGYSLEHYKFTPTPRFAARVMPQLRHAQILKSGRNKEAIKKEFELAIKNLMAELNSLQPQKQLIQREITSRNDLYRRKMEEHDAIRRKLMEIVNELKRHMQKMKERDRRFDFNSYNEELEELKQDLEKQQEERETCQREIERTCPELKDLDETRLKLQVEMDSLNKKLSDHAEAKDKLTSKRAEVQNLIKRFQEEVQRLDEAKESLVTGFRKIQAVVQEKKETAEKTCKERVNTDRTPDSLREEFKMLKLRIKETESHLGDQRALREELKARQLTSNAMLKDFLPMSNLHRAITRLNEYQRDSFETMKFQLARMIRMFFNVMAKSRGYAGRLLVDFREGELHYFVCPDGDSAKKTLKAIDDAELDQTQNDSRNESVSFSQQKQNKVLKKMLTEYALGLSGGERSFSTICYILALWQVMECPFYMLDEFDVFMDAFNRQTSQQALVAHAKLFDMRQFILFTPLSLEDVPGKEHAKVLRLLPPKRRAGRDEGDNGGGPSQSQGGGGGTQAGGSRQGRNSDDFQENVDPEVIPVRKNTGGASSGRANRQRNARVVLGAPT